MKKLLTIVCMLAAAAVFADEPQNLVKNADLKQLSASGGPGGWYIRPAAAPVKRVTLDDGSFALQLASPTADRVFVIQNNVGVKKDGSYMLSIRFRGKPGTKARFYIEGGSPSNGTYWTEAIHITCRSEKWVSAQHPFTAKGNNPHIVMAQLSAGEIELAEPTVVPYEKAEAKDGNLLRNADFTFGGADGGVQGWILRAGDSDTVERFKREEGGKAIRMTGKRILLIQNGVGLKKGERYLLCVSFRGKPGTAGRFYVEGGSPSNGTYWTKAIHIKAADAEKWQTIQLPFTADGDNPHVVMAMLSEGSLEFADPKVVPAPKKKMTTY